MCVAWVWSYVLHPKPRIIHICYLLGTFLVLHEHLQLCVNQQTKLKKLTLDFDRLADETTFVSHFKMRCKHSLSVQAEKFIRHYNQNLDKTKQYKQ